ncbi:hypothetical protein Ct61P_05139 [Colletotrichum tofieldiae]|nr:hypothetical protein Ct61P_05139 [Colletotrichum tofieldiae]
MVNRRARLAVWLVDTEKEHMGLVLHNIEVRPPILRQFEACANKRFSWPTRIELEQAEELVYICVSSKFGKSRPGAQTYYRIMERHICQDLKNWYKDWNTASKVFANSGRSPRFHLLLMPS